jgi:hypothetical protein
MVKGNYQFQIRDKTFEKINFLLSISGMAFHARPLVEPFNHNASSTFETSVKKILGSRASIFHPEKRELCFV